MTVVKSVAAVKTVKELKGLRTLGENKGAVSHCCCRRSCCRRSCHRGCHRGCGRR